MTVFRFDALPNEVFTSITDLLTGPDLLRISHVNRTLFTDQLSGDNGIWKQRIAPTETARTLSLISAKQRYFTSRSYRFPGREIGPLPKNERGGAVELPDEIRTDWSHGSFSFDLHFAMLPSDGAHPNKRLVGGILLGAQSVAWTDNWWADYHQQLVHVDPLGNLYCTVTNTKQIVASKLQLGKWYHLALTFDRSSTASGVQGSGTQCVYLDGQLVHTSEGAVHREWPNLYYLQLGSGCISGGSQGIPVDDFCGWYGFNGLVDECRMWRGALPSDQIQLLSQGAEPPAATTADGGWTRAWSLQQTLRRGADPRHCRLQRVRCARPQEEYAGEIW